MLGDVRAAAQVEEIALLVDRDVAVFEGLDDLHLVGVVLVEGLGLGLGDLLALDREVAGDDLAHPLLDARQILVREPPRHLDVVEEAVLYRRAERQLAARVQLHYGLRHGVRRRVPQHLETLGGLPGNHLEISPAVQRCVEVDELPIELRDHGVAGETFADLLGDIAGLLARFYLQLIAVG